MEQFIDFTSEVITGYTNIATDTIQEVSDSLVESLNKYTETELGKKKEDYVCQDGVCSYYAPIDKVDGKNPEWKNEKITLNGDVPSWLKGTLINSNATDMEVGKYTLN